MIMETALYFTVKITCVTFILWHLWIFIFNRQMYGRWEKVYHLMRIVRIRLWKHRKERTRRKARNARKKAIRGKSVTETATPQDKPKATALSPAGDDVIGKTKIVYLEDPEVARKTPIRSEPMKKEPIEEDEEIRPDDVAQEDRGLTREEKEELMSPVDAEPDPDFDTAMTFEDINNVAEVLMSENPDEQKAIRAATTIHHKMQDTVILSFLTDKLSNQEKVNRLVSECLDESGRPLSKRKATSRKMETFNIDKFV
ncbi:hypothetical protein BACDOR_04670 [Phocaeicola dorei DSM 17855]|uniref:DUF4122 domain-containing protein n=2 Tax=Phocaeicola dorei TaxID=357276 RepID=B6W519_9BACT|nr:hypothetical protein BACDOR_04670 [Phocaeicola dorei DSM 17855]